MQHLIVTIPDGVLHPDRLIESVDWAVNTWAESMPAGLHEAAAPRNWTVESRDGLIFGGEHDFSLTPGELRMYALAMLEAAAMTEAENDEREQDWA